jgi:hypothetical protein
MVSPLEPKAIITEDGKVVNADQLRRYWRDRNERLAVIRRGMFADLPELYPEPEKPLKINQGAFDDPFEQETKPWKVDQWKYAERTRTLINDLTNQVMALRAEKKKADYY